MRTGPQLLGTLWALLTATAAAGADGEDQPAPPPQQRRVMLGTCELALDPDTPEGKEKLGFLACLKASAGGEMTFVSGTPEENSWIRYAHGYAGVFVTPWLAVQARGRVRDQIPLGDEAVEYKDRELDYATVQVGNPAIQHFRLIAGRMRLPFGIDHSEAPEHYRAFENRRFWESPDAGVAIAMDDQRAYTFELGASTNNWQRKGVEERLDERRQREADETGEPSPALSPEEENPYKEIALERRIDHAVSARFGVDFSALDGSRLLFSGYGEKKGVRRFGAGFVTVSRKDDVTEFEFVRRLTTPGGKEMPFEQLLRVGYTAAWRGDTRWVVQFDDERFRFRRGQATYDAKVFRDHMVLRLGLTYHKSESGDDVRRWYVTSGVEAKL